MTSNIQYNPNVFKRIGSDELPDHHLLLAEDTCFYLDEYQVGTSYDEHEGVSRIQNFKIPMNNDNEYRLRHKNRTIRHYGQLIGNLSKEYKLCVIPAPTSKQPNDPEFDGRIKNCLEHASNYNENLEIYDAIFTKESRDPMHLQQRQRNVQELKASLQTDKCVIDQLIKRNPSIIFIFDDVITTGCTFVTCKSLLIAEFLLYGERVPDIRGLFLARRVPQKLSDPFEDFDFGVNL